jgi:alkaline phosphatase D
MHRRDVLRLGVGAMGLGAVGWATSCSTPTGPAPTTQFSSGIASGLHSDTEVVIWTRVDPRVAGPSPVDWEVSTDPGFGSVVASGTEATSPLSDHTVKVLVGGLDPDRSYWYRFSTSAYTSAVGRARTLPAPGASVTQLSFAYASCQSYANGYYAAWRDIAAQPVDAVLFLGDYIYEAALIQLLRTVREEGLTEARTLDQYRAKYQLYKTDPDLQSAHAAHPFVPIWDDHEVHNDYDSTEFATDPGRIAAAYQAWFEYQPVWPVAGTRIYRDLQWGDLGHLFMLDTRQYRGAHRPGAPLFGTRDLTSFESDPSRSILGPDQRAWLTGGLASAQAAGTTWKVIGNQVMIAPLRVKDLDTPAARAADPSLPLHAGTYTDANFDTWDGFVVERDVLLSYLHTAGIDNTLFVTGDYHAFWQAPLRTDYDDAASPVVANEFAAGAISSAGGAQNENVLYGSANNAPFDPPFSYAQGTLNGYGLVQATHSELQVTYYMNDAASRTTLPQPKVRFTLDAGDPTATKQLL